jgi:putative sigma-54 modulation protein
VNIAITFRHMDATEAMKAHATDKVAKLQKFLRQPMKGQVTLSCEKKLHRAEIDVHSGAEHYHAHVESEDMYATIDLVLDKLERQIRAVRKVSTSRKKGADRASDHLLPSTDDAGHPSGSLPWPTGDE